ncbi:MAG TPA: sulfatase [Bacteroidales bacterium]|nr:sulfatase [Bacteroidales bacterium]
MRALYKYFVFGSIFLYLLTVGSCRNDKDAPNIVFIMADQYRTAALGFLEQDPVITPNIDRLASEGIFFSNATSTMPVCSPYRAMLMTGNYYTINNVPMNCLSDNPGNYLRTDDNTILDALAASGYNVGYIGKWHLEEPKEPYVTSGNNAGPGKANWEEWTPPERRHGVQFWYAYNTFDNHFKPHYWTNKSTRDKRLEIEEWSPIHETSVAIDFIKNTDGTFRDTRKPFALFVSYNPPHTGYSYVPEKYRDLYKDMTFEQLNTRESVLPGSPGEDHARRVLADYFACVTGIDEQVGRIMECLVEQGLRKNTILVFTSDHGNCLGAHNHVTKNIFWEESFSVPLIISWPGKTGIGVSDILISPTDLFPTLAALAGIGSGDVQGMDLSQKIVTGEGKEPLGALYAYLTHSQADSLVGGFPGKAWGERGFRIKDYMLVVNKLPGEPTVYYLSDLKADPFQMRNIALQNRELATAILEDLLNPKLESIGDEWYRIPVTKQSSYPNNLRELQPAAPVWGMR